MASSNHKWRGRYKEFFRDCNPYKFPAAGKRKNFRLKGPKSNRRPVVSSCNGIGRDSMSEDLGDCDISLNPTDADISPGDFSEYYGDDKMEDIGDDKGYDFELDESAAARVDEDDLLDSYECYVLVLSLVMKHKLTREAFKDLPAVIEAHCPRPNYCRTTVNQLLEFETQSKGNVVKHYFCSYCKAYFGRDVENGGGICVICGQIIPKSSGNGFFIEVPIEKRLQKFFLGKFPIRP